MPVYTSDGLPVRAQLALNGVTTYDINHAPADTLRIGVLNLMPLKEDAEADIIRVLSSSPINIALTWHTPRGHRSRHCPQEHLDKFYTPLTLADADAAIVTGAPLERIKYEDVDYWNEFCGVADEMERSHMPHLFLCWAAFAGLYHRYGIEKLLLERKISGVFAHDITDTEAYIVRGITAPLYAPQSRFITVDYDLCSATKGLRIVAGNRESGPHILTDRKGFGTYILGHGEYAPDTLKREYMRDLERGLNPHVPTGYFADDTPHSEPVDRWTHQGAKVFMNWAEQAYRQTRATEHLRD